MYLNCDCTCNLSDVEVASFFISSKEIFSSIKFSSSILEKRIRELAFLNKGIGIKLIDNTSKKSKEILHKYDGGILEFVKHINQKKPILVNKNENEVFKKPVYVTATKNNVIVECSFEWNAGYSEEVLPFTNNIPQKDGGTHLLGFRSALTRIINKYSSDYKIIVVGDATMAPYEITNSGGSIEHWNEEPSVTWINRLSEHFNNMAWLNPVPDDHWDYSSSVCILKDLFDDRMYPLTLKGLENAMGELTK